MAQYVFFMILSIGLFFASPSTSSSSSEKSTKETKTGLKILKTGGQEGWFEGGD